jgi:hypothetical protein
LQLSYSSKVVYIGSDTTSGTTRSLMISHFSGRAATLVAFLHLSAFFL